MKPALILFIRGLSWLMVPLMRRVKDLPRAERLGVDRPELFERILMRVFPYRIISAETPEGRTLYIRRFFLTPRRWRFRLFLHHICRSDSDRDPHDHPFDFYTTLWKGSYLESVNWERGYFGDYEPTHVRLGLPGDAFDNKAEHVHQLSLTEPMWTFLLVSRARREWGFLTRTGWQPWRKYLDLPDAADALEDV